MRRQRRRRSRRRAAIQPEEITDRYTRRFRAEHASVCAAACLRLGPIYLPVTARQLCAYLLALVCLGYFLIWHQKAALFALLFLLCAFYGLVILFRLGSVLLALLRAAMGRPCEEQVTERELAALKDADLPVYTILVPMYQEPEVAQKIARAVTSLDYPSEKLDVKLLLEEDDPETRAKVSEVMNELPPCVEVIVCPAVPKGEPRTKPRACNWGLDRAKGKYLVIYDAEDRPERDQLKKAVVAFRRLEAARRKPVVCLQAKLNYFNSRQNLLTRFFTLEYTNWFDLFLPGLHAFRTPIPLGGTSNHFVTDTLRELGGWDPFNVTEDCDLGIRLARRGYRTLVLDSTTWEEANSRLRSWVRQRSRWVKGYFQTHLVHTRDSFLPFFVLAALFFVAFLLCREGLSQPEYRDRHDRLEILGCGSLGLGALAAVLGLWTLGERILRRPAAAAREGRLGFWSACSFRITVGGLSAMLILNLLFWFLGLLYLFRHPIADALPAFADKPTPFEFLDERPLRQSLKGWQLKYENVTEEQYRGYTVWKTLKQWWSGELAWDHPDSSSWRRLRRWWSGQPEDGTSQEYTSVTAVEILSHIDPWSFWSQVLYPAVVGLFIANFIFVLLGMVSCAKRRLWGLLPMALLMPVYWVLISVGAVRGVLQLFTNPWYWAKTQHGRAEPPPLSAKVPGEAARP